MTKQSEQQADIIGFEGLDVESIRSIDDEKHRWPEAVRQIYETLRHDLEQAQIDPMIAIKLVHSICEQFGGMQIYLPRGEQLDREIENLKIWNEFSGDNVPDLAQRYHKSMQHIYRVIDKMRKREMSKRQYNII